MSEVYRDFLTDGEIESMMHNKDIWMDSDEVVKRLTALAEKRAKEAQQDNG
jgi:hypothetical protein